MKMLCKSIAAFIVAFSIATFIEAGEFVKEGGDNGAIISTKVIEALDEGAEIDVLIKLKYEADDALTSRMTTSADPAGFISKSGIKGLQSRLESALAREGLQGDATIVHQLENTPWVTGTISRKAFNKLKSNPNVAMIVEDRIMKAYLAESAPLVNSDDANNLGYTGNGVAVAVIDTGIDADHSDLKDNVVWEVCFLKSGCPTGGKKGSGPGSAKDGDGHGTHVSGIVTSAHSKYKGIAPDAGIVAIKVLSDDGYGSTSDIIAGIDWVTSNADTYGIGMINMSLGGPPYSKGDCDGSDQAMAAAADAAKNAGVAIFAASGNESKSNKMSSPACLSAVISVGAVYDDNLGNKDWGDCKDSKIKPDDVVCWSNASAKLDLLAPGSVITSSKKGGGTAGMSGTSMASPLAAAVGAVLAQKDTSHLPGQT